MEGQEKEGGGGLQTYSLCGIKFGGKLSAIVNSTLAHHNDFKKPQILYAGDRLQELLDTSVSVIVTLII